MGVNRKNREIDVALLCNFKFPSSTLSFDNFRCKLCIRMAPKYIDNTGLFRDILKESQNREDIKPDKNRILNKRKEKDPLEVQAHLIIDHTTQLKCFLSENRDSYIDVLNKTY